MLKVVIYRKYSDIPDIFYVDDEVTVLEAEFDDYEIQSVFITIDK